jgi:hypothetical protein
MSKTGNLHGQWSNAVPTLASDLENAPTPFHNPKNISKLIKKLGDT